jgi:hypothetical protein
MGWGRVGMAHCGAIRSSVTLKVMSWMAKFAGASLAVVLVCPLLAQSAVPAKETLSYNIEWRLIYAGSASLKVDPTGSLDGSPWQIKLHLESAGLVSKLYHLDDNYDVLMDSHFCASSSDLDSMEKNRHRETKVEFDRARGKATYLERDLLKNQVIKTAETATPHCVSDIIAALYKLRTLKLEPGQSDQIVISDGKKTISARVEAQARETIKIKSGTFSTVRYEANIFNGALYNRKGQFHVWLTDDGRRLPVQIRARMSFPIGSITLELDKEEHL